MRILRLPVSAKDLIRPMLPRTLLGTAVIPDTKTELQLFQSGELFLDQDSGTWRSDEQPRARL